MSWRAYLTASCLGALLVACGGDVPLPPVKPLLVDDGVVEQLYGGRPGAHTVVTVRNLVLPASDEQRELLLNLYYPAAGGDYPLLIFSHGNWSNKDSYDRVIEYWVSHGYVVLATDHLDCCSAVKGIFNSLRYSQLGLIEGRVSDINRLLASLPAIAQLDPAFSGKADTSRIGITGHSFGAFSAQQFGGAMAYDPDAEQFIAEDVPEVKAIVAISPPGPMFDVITEGSWLKMNTPMLITTGTWDIQPQFWPDWRMHLMSWDTALPHDNYALVIEGADHFLGNLICRTEREEPPQEDALRMVQIVTTAFLDAYVKRNAEALDFVSSNKLDDTTGGFARLSHR